MNERSSTDNKRGKTRAAQERIQEGREGSSPRYSLNTKGRQGFLPNPKLCERMALQKGARRAGVYAALSGECEPWEGMHIGATGIIVQSIEDHTDPD